MVKNGHTERITNFIDFVDKLRMLNKITVLSLE